MRHSTLLRRLSGAVVAALLVAAFASPASAAPWNASRALTALWAEGTWLWTVVNPVLHGFSAGKGGMMMDPDGSEGQGSAPTGGEVWTGVTDKEGMGMDPNGAQSEGAGETLSGAAGPPAAASQSAL